MTLRPLVIWLVTGALALPAHFAAMPRDARAEESQPAATSPSDTPEQGDKVAAAVAELPPDAVTAHRLTLAGRTIDYTARAGSLSLTDDKGVATAELFYVAFLRDGADANRPITFALNGGPGAASAYLDLLATGPRILDLGDGRHLPPAHGEIVDNTDSWLDFTDLVFVDPIGTGYSIAKGGDNTDKRFFGVREDLDALSSAIRLALTKLGRLDSPIYLLGESYGGFRAARLPLQLSEKQGIKVSGTILLSPVIEFSLMHSDGFNPLPWALRLPSYAAVNLAKQGSLTPEALTGTETFALGDYLVALAAPLSDSRRRDQAYAAAAQLIGIPESVVAHWNGLVPVRAFAREIDRAEGGMAVPYDGSVEVPATEPGARRANRGDPILAALTAPVTEGVVRYLRDELRFKSDRDYVLLNRKAASQWNWDDDSGDAPGAASALDRALQRDPQLRVMVVCGTTDLVAPYFMNAYVINHLPSAARDRIVLKLYAGGHMMYLRPESRAALQSDARALFGAP